jgi:hypothetical protein
LETDFGRTSFDLLARSSSSLLLDDVSSSGFLAVAAFRGVADSSFSTPSSLEESLTAFFVFSSLVAVTMIFGEYLGVEPSFDDFTLMADLQADELFGTITLSRFAAVATLRVDLPKFDDSSSLDDESESLSVFLLFVSTIFGVVNSFDFETDNNNRAAGRDCSSTRLASSSESLDESESTSSRTTTTLVVRLP